MCRLAFFAGPGAAEPLDNAVTRRRIANLVVFPLVVVLFMTIAHLLGWPIWGAVL